MLSADCYTTSLILLTESGLCNCRVVISTQARLFGNDEDKNHEPKAVSH